MAQDDITRWEPISMDFRTAAPAGAKRIPFKIIRCKKKKVVCFFCVSDRPIVIATHWTRTRSILCPEKDCPYCYENSQQRWRGYLFGIPTEGDAIAIIEYTGGVSEEVQAFWRERGTLRGAGITFARPGNRVNSPLAVTFAKTHRDENSMPDCPDLGPILKRIYDLPTAANIERDLGIVKLEHGKAVG